MLESSVLRRCPPCIVRAGAGGLLVASVSCGTPPPPALVQPGVPGAAPRAISADAATDLPLVRYTAADVRFMQQMLPHHAQALEMTALVEARSARDDVRVLARRIELSQADEIQMMQQWLDSRGEPLPDAHAHHGGVSMPGMLSADEMQRLEDARGEVFDRLFLEMMIRHHEGALTMVRELLASGGAQEPEVFAFASDVETDQQLEIARMRALRERR